MTSTSSPLFANVHARTSSKVRHVGVTPPLYSVEVKSFVVLLLVACVAYAEPSPAGKDPLVIGEYKMGRVVDGDTIHVEGLDSSLRLLGFDAEETFKHAGERRAFDAGWEQYKTGVRTKNGVRSLHPVKFATPMGDEAKKWAEKWFTGVDTVRLERDDPEEIRDRYNRYLAYVLAKKNGTWVNYNVEAVRQRLRRRRERSEGRAPRDLAVRRAGVR